MSWIEERQVGGAMVVKIVAVIGGAFVGLVVGSVIRGFTDVAVDGPVIGRLIQLVCMSIGAWMFYRRFVRSRS